MGLRSGSTSEDNEVSPPISRSPCECLPRDGFGNYPSRRYHCAAALEPSSFRHRRETSLQSWHRPPPSGQSFCCGASGHEGDRLPFSKRNDANHPDTGRSPPPHPRQIGADGSLVDKHQPRGIKNTLLPDPTSAYSRHIRSLPFRRWFFFKGDVVAIETPERATASSKSVACAALRPSPPKSDPVVRPSNPICLRKLFQWRNASSTRLRHSALAFVPALQPLYRRTHAHLETFSRLAPRRTAFNSFDYAFPQITRIGLRHRPPPPQRRINARRFVHP